MKKIKTQFGQSLTGDFEESTWIFKMSDGYKVRAGQFAIGEVGECGNHCEAYKPNNNKNGRCKHYGYTYEQTDKFKTLKI